MGGEFGILIPCLVSSLLQERTRGRAVTLLPLRTALPHTLCTVPSAQQQVGVPGHICGARQPVLRRMLAYGMQLLPCTETGAWSTLSPYRSGNTSFCSSPLSQSITATTTPSLSTSLIFLYLPLQSLEHPVAPSLRLYLFRGRSRLGFPSGHSPLAP